MEMEGVVVSSSERLTVQVPMNEKEYGETASTEVKTVCLMDKKDNASELQFL